MDTFRTGRTTSSGGPLAVVTSADHPTGLGGGRALHLAGARVTGLTRAPDAHACRSRVWTDVVRVRGQATEDTWMDALHQLGETLDQPAFLLPIQDHLVATVSNRRDELADHFRLVLPSDEIVQTFLDKTRFYDWAKTRDLPQPESRVVYDRDGLRSALREMPYPLILKPLYRTPAWDRASPTNKAFRLDSGDDLKRIDFDLFSAASAFILSQWIEGPDHAVHYCLAYCDKPGSMAASYTGRKLLQYPRLTGSTAICVGTDNCEVRELAQEVFRLSDYQGLGSVEVKYGPDNRPYITEPTVGRPNLQSYSAVAAGCNLQALAMAHALGLEPPPMPRTRRGCWWMEETAVFELMTSSNPEPVPWKLLLRELIRTPRIKGAYWSVRDPRPLLGFFRQKFRRGISRLFRFRHA